MPYVSPSEISAAQEAMDALGVELTSDVIEAGLKAAAEARERILKPDWSRYDV